MSTDDRRAAHILFINEFFWPDVCASAAVLTDHLPLIAKACPDWRITVLAGDRAWDRPDTRWPPAEIWRGVQIVRVPRGPVRRSLPGRAWGFARFHRAAIAAGRALDRPDVVVASTAPPLGGGIGVALAQRHRARLIYKVLDLYPDCAEALGVIRPNGLVAKVWRAADTSVMRKSAAVVPIATRMAERIVATRGIDAARVRTIHDGIDPARVTGGNGDSFRGQHELKDKFVVQYAGNMGLSHPFDSILAAAESLKHDSNIIFQFIGAGPGRAAIERSIVERRLPIQLLDFQPAERLADMLAAADICLISQHSSLFDQALPHKVYAALAAQRPAIFIGDPRSEIVDWLRGSNRGLCVEQGDPIALIAAISRLRAAKPIRAEPVHEFTAARAAEAWVRLLNEVLARNP